MGGSAVRSARKTPRRSFPESMGVRMKRPPRYAYPIAIVLGVLAAFTPANLPLDSSSIVAALLISTAIFGFAGLVLGTVWPSGGWVWGIWLVAPGFLLVTIGLIASGELGSFLGDDLPFLLLGLLGAGFGSGIGARLRGRTQPSE